jgi:hypothetical protein
MPVQITALAGIVQQPVPVAEVDFLTNAVHRAPAQSSGVQGLAVLDSLLVAVARRTIGFASR